MVAPTGVNEELPGEPAKAGRAGAELAEPQAAALRSVAVFGREVIPRFDKDPVHSTTRFREAARRTGH